MTDLYRILRATLDTLRVVQLKKICQWFSITITHTKKKDLICLLVNHYLPFEPDMSDADNPSYTPDVRDSNKRKNFHSSSSLSRKKRAASAASATHLSNYLSDTTDSHTDDVSPSSRLGMRTASRGFDTGRNTKKVAHKSTRNRAVQQYNESHPIVRSDARCVVRGNYNDIQRAFAKGKEERHKGLK